MAHKMFSIVPSDPGLNRGRDFLWTGARFEDAEAGIKKKCDELGLAQDEVERHFRRLEAEAEETRKEATCSMNEDFTLKVDLLVKCEPCD